MSLPRNAEQYRRFTEAAKAGVSAIGALPPSMQASRRAPSVGGIRWSTQPAAGNPAAGQLHVAGPWQGPVPGVDRFGQGPAGESPFLLWGIRHIIRAQNAGGLPNWRRPPKNGACAGALGLRQLQHSPTRVSLTDCGAHDMSPGACPRSCLPKRQRIMAPCTANE